MTAETFGSSCRSRGGRGVRRVGSVATTPGVRGPSGAFVAGGRFRSAVRGTGAPGRTVTRSHSIAANRQRIASSEGLSSTPHHPLECRPEPTPSTPARGGSGLHCRSERGEAWRPVWAAGVFSRQFRGFRVVTGTTSTRNGANTVSRTAIASATNRSVRCRPSQRSDALSEKTKRCCRSHHSKVRDEFLDRASSERTTAELALKSIIRNARTVPWIPNTAEFSATCERYVPIEEDPPDPSLYERPGDSHYN